MALVEDPYFVTDDPYGGGYEQDEEEEMVEEVIDPDLEEDPSRQADELAEEEVPYEEPEEEAENWPEEEVVGVEQPEQPLEEEAWEENVEEEAYLDETNAQVEADLGDEPGEEPWAEEVHEEPLEAEAQEPGFEEEETLDLPAEVEVEPCSPGLDVEPEDEGLGFRTTLDEVDYTPFEPEEHAEEDESDEEPAWLKGIGILDPKAAEDADVSAAFLDGLTGSQTDLDLAFPQYIPSLARYLVGHPEALVTKKKKGHRKGAGKRYFGGEDRSEDVMADKVVTGCWACGKLDHESQECAFKRCFVCSEQGHELSECRWRNIFCKRCGRQGHLADNCPVEAYDESFYKVNDTDDVSFTRCLKCGDEGHINCGNPADLPFVEAETNQYEHYQERRDDWSSQGQGWNENHWQPKHAMHMAAAWMMQGMSLPVGPAMDWAPPAGDGGGYDKGDEEHGGYGYGGRRWPRTGNSKGWGGQRWNGGGWGRSQSWDGGGWGGWDGGPSHKRRRH